MKGVNYVTDDRNKVVAVMIDIKKNGELWEDLQDYFSASLNKKTKKTSLLDFKKELKKAGKL